jgi:uncharacterized protein DUF4350
MTAQPVFSPRLLIAWIAAAVVTFACSLYFMGGGSNVNATDNVGPGSFSHSAIGHAGFADVLQRLGIAVVKSQYNSLAKLGAGSVLVVAEPRPGTLPDADTRALLNGRTALLVLPKWRGPPSDRHRGWITRATERSLSDAQWALALTGDRGEVVRVPPTTSFRVNTLHATPTLAAPMQLVKGGKLWPLVASADGILVGEILERGRHLLVLADPDVIANHGLTEPANAELAVALIRLLRGANGRVVFDETVHGFLAPPASPLMLLFRFPFVVVTLQALVAVALLLWATLARFGAPQTAPPALDAGKQGLIGNAAKLLEFAGHRQVMLKRYVHATIRDVARQIHAPRGLSEGALIAWLQRVGQARAIGIDCDDVLRRLDAAGGDRRVEAPLVARDIYQWKRGILDGHSGDSRDHRRHPQRGAQGGDRPG